MQIDINMQHIFTAPRHAPTPPANDDSHEEPRDDSEDNLHNDSGDEPIDSIPDTASCDGDVESEAEVNTAITTRHKPPGAPPATERERSRMTQGGFTYVEAARKPTTRSTSAKIFTNSALKQKNSNPQLQTVSRHGSNERTNSAVFVSNFTPTTKPDDVAVFLRDKYQRRFKVVQIPSKYKDCSSFKIEVHPSMKNTLLNRDNWAPNVYVREFYQNARGLVSLAHH